VIKVGEEKELLKVLKDYKAKYVELEKHTKQSAKNTRQFEKEVKSLHNTKKKLEGQKKVFLESAGGIDVDDPNNSEIQEIEKEWETAKAKILEEREQLKERCAQLNVQIKAKTASA